MELVVGLVQISVTAVVTLSAVLLGGWLTTRSQDRFWKRDHARQWRDIRLSAYGEFLTAFREYIAFVLRPSTTILAVPRPHHPHDLMPFFDEEGSPFRERLEATKTTVRLISGGQSAVRASNTLVRRARLLAAQRAIHSVDSLPADDFRQLWAAEKDFIIAARSELGLDPSVDIRAGSVYDAEVLGQGPERSDSATTPGHQVA